MTDDHPKRGDRPRPEPRRRPDTTRQDTPAHPPLAAALMMIGIVVFLVVISVIAVL
jgi:hypothetical protein